MTVTALCVQNTGLKWKVAELAMVRDFEVLHEKCVHLQNAGLLT